LQEKILYSLNPDHYDFAEIPFPHLPKKRNIFKEITQQTPPITRGFNLIKELRETIFSFIHVSGS
jgi:hypothetical protein